MNNIIKTATKNVKTLTTNTVTKTFLQSKVVLYVVLFLAITNIFGYLMLKELNAVIFLFLAGVLTTFFSKNMIIVLLVSMLTTNLYMGTKWFSSQKEGFKGKDKKKGKRQHHDMNMNMNMKHRGRGGSEHFENAQANYEVQPASEELDDEEATGRKPKLDYAATLEAAYDNLDKMLGSDAIRSMTNDTQRLAEKQKSLMGNIKKLEPLMTKAGGMLEGLNVEQMGGMMSKMEGLMSKFSGGGAGGDKK
jgi:hypothetical protein